MKAVTKSTSIGKFSTTVNCIVVSKSPIRIYNAMLPLFPSRSFHTDRSNDCLSLNILGNQSVGRKYFEMRFGWAPVSRRQVTWCIILILGPIETRTKYTDCPITVIIEVLIVCLSGENFTSFTKSSSPAFLSDFNVAKYVLSHPL